MKEYNSIPLEDEEVQALLDISKLIGEPVKAILFPGDFDTAIKNLSFTNNAVFWYEDNNVIGLHLLGIEIEKLPDSFGNFSNLFFLEINDCLIKLFPNTLKKLKMLEHFSFINDAGSTSELVNIDLPDIFDNLKNLKRFYIDGLFNVYLPPSFFELESLEEIQLKHCLFSPKQSNFMINYDNEDPDHIVKHIHELPGNLKKFKLLKKLILYHLEIDEVPNSLLDLTTLIELDMSYSNQSKYSELKNIEIIFKLTSLEKLNLSCCLLKSIPKTIGNLINLKELDLTRNNIKEIPKEIENCNQLEKISLRNNFFDENLKIWIKAFISLQKLNYMSIGKKFYEFLPKELIEKPDLNIII